MYRRIKGLGLALCAVLALSAALTSAAQARFYYSAEHTILSGGQKSGTTDVFTAGSGFGGVTCTTVEFSGTAVGGESESQVITPAYKGCKDSFGRTVDIDNSGFTYEFTQEEQVNLAGSLTLTITSGGSVVCTVAITSPQTDNGITYTNLGGTNGIEVTRHSTNVASTTSGGFFNCGISNGTHTEGTYDGTAVITAKDTGGAAAEFQVGDRQLNVRPAGGGAKLSFVGSAQNTVKTIEVVNAGTLVANMGEHTIREGGVQAEGNFKIVGGTCNPTLQEDLNAGETCTVTVKFISGLAGKAATYRLTYGNRLCNKTQEATLAIES
jgi:hypothetical protein